jgi:zinc transport system substrate-binding protein
MKKISAALPLFLPLLWGLAGCANKSAAVPKREGTIRVTVTIFPAYDFVRAVAKDRAELVMLLPPAAESHSFEPSPRDIISLQDSDLFIYIGGESEQWIKRLLPSLDTGDLKMLALMDTVEPVEEEMAGGMEAAGGETPLSGAGEGLEYDEHIWTAPENAKRMVLAIGEALGERDGANAEFYRQNAAAYGAQLDGLDRAFREVTSGARRKTVVFGSRFPFRYFADAYGLSYFAAFPGCSTETEPSAATVAFLIDKIKAEGIPVVFYPELASEKMADAISEATGAKKLLLHSGHNVSKADFEGGVTYLELQRANVERLREALQ